VCTDFGIQTSSGTTSTGRNKRENRCAYQRESTRDTQEKSAVNELEPRAVEEIVEISEKWIIFTPNSLDS